MVQMVSCVPDSKVLEKYAICSKTVVCLKTDLSSVPLHPSRAPIFQPPLAPWEEVQTCIHQNRRREFVCNGLHPWCYFQLHQVGNKMFGHQKLVPVRSIPYGRYGVFYGRGIDGDNITPHDIPTPLPCQRMEAENFRTVEEWILNGEGLRLMVDNDSAMSAWCRCYHHLKFAGLPRVNSLGKFGLLKHTTINLSLR